MLYLEDLTSIAILDSKTMSCLMYYYPAVWPFRDVYCLHGRRGGILLRTGLLADQKIFGRFLDVKYHGELSISSSYGQHLLNY